MIAPAPDTLDAIADAFARILAPPPKPRSLLAFARSLRLPDGPDAGELFNPEGHPAELEILRAFALGGHDHLVTLGPVQDGKSWVTVIVPLLYCLAELRQSAVYALPDMSMSGKLWRSKMRPAIEGSGLAWLLPDTGPGSAGGHPEDILVTTGARLFLLGAGAKNEAGQAAVTARYVFVDERDSIRMRFVELLLARNMVFDDGGRSVSTSTIKHDAEGASSTVMVYAASLGYRLWFACPTCRGWQTWEWERVEADYTSDDSAAATVRLHCLHCVKPITEEQRQAALHNYRLVARGQTVNAEGKVEGETPASRVWGLRWSALDSPLKSLGRLVVMYRQAVVRRDAYADHDPLRQFYRDQLVQQYRGDLESLEDAKHINPAYLAARANAHGWDPVSYDRDEFGLYARHIAPPPPDAQVAVVSIDVQKDRIYWSAIAGHEDGRTWDMAWGYEHATKERDPTSTGELHALFDRVDALVPELVGELTVVAMVIDVGYRQDEITSWLKGHPDWIPVSGAGEEVAGRMRQVKTSGNIPGVCYKTRPEGWRLPGAQSLLLIDANRMKEAAQLAFLRPPGSAGAAHLPSGLKANDSYCKMLCGELLVDSPSGKKVWKKVYLRHDFLDLRTYATAMLRRHFEHSRRGLVANPAMATPLPPLPRPDGGGWLGDGGGPGPGMPGAW